MFVNRLTHFFGWDVPLSTRQMSDFYIAGNQNVSIATAPKILYCYAANEPKKKCFIKLYVLFHPWKVISYVDLNFGTASCFHTNAICHGIKADRKFLMIKHAVLTNDQMDWQNGPVYTRSHQAFSLIRYLSDLLKRFHLHFNFFHLYKCNGVHVNESNRYALHFIHYQLISISDHDRKDRLVSLLLMKMLVCWLTFSFIRSSLCVGLLKRYSVTHPRWCLLY